MAQFYSAKRRVTTREIITTTISSLDGFGQGVSHHNGKTLFIRGALPGETVALRINEDKRHYAIASVVRRYNDSPERVTPRCPHYGICGGCQLQHASEDLAQHSKAAALSRQFDAAVEGPITGPGYGYRRRTRLGITFDAKSAQFTMGFRQLASRQRVDVHQCPILVPELEALLVPLRNCLAEFENPACLRHVELVAGDNMPAVVIRHVAPLAKADSQKLERFSHSHRVALFLAPSRDILVQITGEPLYYHSDGRRLAFSPRDFIQVNDIVNQQMVATALAWLMIESQDRVLDLFCGMGNFTIPLARQASSVIGVEGVAELVVQGRQNAERNALTNVTFCHENLEQDITVQPWANQRFDKVLLDPARAGALGVMQHIVKLAPQRVVYVSCNPSTLLRDSEVLSRAGYTLERLAMLDMFPHTAHIESMVLFKRR